MQHWRAGRQAEISLRAMSRRFHWPAGGQGCAAVTGCSGFLNVCSSRRDVSGHMLVCSGGKNHFLCRVKGLLVLVCCPLMVEITLYTSSVDGNGTAS